MMAVKDDWMRAAMADDRVVVELLVRLKQAHAVAPVKAALTAALFPPTKWGVRQPRSRMSMRFDAVTMQKDAADSTRNSPTTPLSWSAGAGADSPSCTADGFEESSFAANRCAVTARSKGIGSASNDFRNNSGIKRLRRKKTFAQLKEEENFLLKEKMYLKKEIENMQATFMEQKARNTSLKKMKVYLNLHSAEQQTVPDPCWETHEPSGNKDNVLFLLPDLNMEPCEEDSGFEVF